MVEDPVVDIETAETKVVGGKLFFAPTAEVAVAQRVATTDRKMA